MSLLDIIRERVKELDQLSKDSSCEIRHLSSDKITNNVDEYIVHLARVKNTNDIDTIMTSIEVRIPLLYLCGRIIAVYAAVRECEEDNISLYLGSKDPMIADIVTGFADSLGEYSYERIKKILRYILTIVSIGCLIA